MGWGDGSGLKGPYEWGDVGGVTVEEGRCIMCDRSIYIDRNLPGFLRPNVIE
jgi:hypothetical protein